MEISNRNARFSSMATDEKLAEIANLIENMLKRDGKFIKLDYSVISYGLITDEDITAFRKKMHCFRHATDESIIERQSYSDQQKDFFIDYGLTLVKMIHSMIYVNKNT